MDKWLERTIKTEIGKVRGAEVIDCGVGNGLNAVGLAVMGAKVTGIDRSGKMLERTRERAKKEGVEISVAKAKAQEYKTSKKFDIVLFMYVIHLIESGRREQAIINILNLTKEGGLVIFTGLEDVEPIEEKLIGKLREALDEVKEERRKVYDPPHEHADFPHEHNVYSLVGRKRGLGR